MSQNILCVSLRKPTDDYPVGRMVEREVDIGDAATAEEINIRNGWKER